VYIVVLVCATQNIHRYTHATQNIHTYTQWRAQTRACAPRSHVTNTRHEAGRHSCLPHYRSPIENTLFLWNNHVTPCVQRHQKYSRVTLGWCLLGRSDPVDIYIYIYIYMCVALCLCVWLCVNVWFDVVCLVCMYVCTSVSNTYDACMCTCICVYVCLHLAMYMHISYLKGLARVRLRLSIKCRNDVCLSGMMSVWHDVCLAWCLSGMMSVWHDVCLAW
jgi:hypothetical protein